MNKRSLLNSMWSTCDGDIRQYVSMLINANLCEREIIEEIKVELPDYLDEAKTVLKEWGNVRQTPETDEFLYGSEVVVKIPGAELFVSKHTDPDYPGVTVMLKPQNTNYEIDCVDVEAIGSELAAETSDSAIGDVFIRTWADVNNEDYTHKEKIEGSEIGALR